MQYELFYLLPTQYTDAEVAGIMEKVAGMITKAGGEMTRHEMLSRQKLAYPINGINHGVYVLAHFTAETSVVNPLDRQFRLTDELLRHQLCVMPKGADKKTFTLMAYASPLSDEGRREDGPRAPRTATATGGAAVAPAKTDEVKLDIETINKKLDDMLSEDVAKQA